MVSWGWNGIKVFFLEASEPRWTTGDRVALFGRWILDTGHDEGGFYRTEIHPPLLVATASVQQEGKGSEFTRALFMSRPYLVGQTYTKDVNDAYNDGAQDDGTFFDHLIGEIVDVVELESRRVEAHPKIKSYPFKGSYRLHVIVRPPPRPDSAEYRLQVSFRFTVRTGCQVEVKLRSNDAVDVFITLNSRDYDAPALPTRRDRVYTKDELDQLTPGTGFKIIAMDYIVIVVAVLVPWGGIFLDPYIAYVLNRGILTDEYDSLPETNIRDSTDAVLNVPVDRIPAGLGVVVDNDQPYPISGWLEARWVPRSPC